MQCVVTPLVPFAGFGHYVLLYLSLLFAHLIVLKQIKYHFSLMNHKLTECYSICFWYDGAREVSGSSPSIDLVAIVSFVVTTGYNYIIIRSSSFQHLKDFTKEKFSISCDESGLCVKSSRL